MSRHPLNNFLVLVLTSLVAPLAFGQSPTGLWITIDDASQKPLSQVKISETDGVWTGMIVKLLDPKDAPDSVCDACTDERKGKPVMGMAILRNLRKDGDRWSGGDIMDPNNGKVYRVQIIPSADHKSLSVRGYIGTPLFGRSQIWKRVE